MPRLLLLLVLAAGLTLAACGDDDDDNGDNGANGGATVEETAPADTTVETTPGDTGAGAAVQISADPDGALAYEQDEVTAQAGQVGIEFTNDSSVPHDVRIESEDGEELGGTEVITGDTARAQVELEPGTYTFYCSVNGHRQAGMEGTLVVE